MIQVLWFGAPRDNEPADEVVLAFGAPSQATELYSRLRNLAEEMEATGKPGQVVLKGRIRK